MPVFVKFCRFIFKIKGWKLVRSEAADSETLSRCVMIAAPHTTNWDAIYTIACFDMMGINWRFTLKKEWLKPPFGRLLRKVGAIGIDRTPKKEGEPRQSMVEAMAELFKQQDKLCIVVTPEGTRSKQEKWRTGFYHVAKMANVPIALGYMDYAKKEAGIQVVVYPTDDMHADMKKIMEFYQTINGKFPEKFSIDKQYLQAPQEKN